MGFAKDYLWAKLGLLGSRYWRAVLRGGDVQNQYDITAKQTGTGEPSPENVRPILPGLTLVRDDDSVLDVYGGTLDTASGVLTVSHAFLELDGTNVWSVAGGYTPTAFYTRLIGAPEPEDNYAVEFSHFRYARVMQTDGYGARIYWYNECRAILRFDANYTDKPEDASGMQAWCLAQAQAGTPFQAVYPLATPVTYQLTQAEVKRAVRELRR